MSIKIIQDRLATYASSSKQEEENAFAEIAQEIALAGLARSDFFKHAVFQGGTCLRILYNMERFSEDLDFLLKKPDPHFRLLPYLKNLELEYKAYGIEVAVQDRSKADETVRKAFLKGDSVGKILSLKEARGGGRYKSLRIKLEIDTNPPDGSGHETRYLDFPFSFPIAVQDPQSLFAGKSHALLCREYVKGRDWYDFVWYVGRKVPLNYSFLSRALDQVGPWERTGIEVTKDWYLSEMEKKIEAIDWDDAKKDVIRFLKVRDIPLVEHWGREFFLDRLKKLEEYLQ
jgi:hypothetical protein